MRLPKVTTVPMLVLFLASAVWLALILATPFMIPSGTATDLSGRVGHYDNREFVQSLAPVPRVVYWAGDIECHQLAERSLFLNGNQMAFCSRDLGIFIGIAAGFGVVAFYRYRIHPVLVLVGLIPIALDGGMQFLTDYESNNMLRIATGFIAGLVTSLLLAHMLFALTEDTGATAPSSGQTG